MVQRTAVRGSWLSTCTFCGANLLHHAFAWFGDGTGNLMTVFLPLNHFPYTDPLIAVKVDPPSSDAEHAHK